MLNLNLNSLLALGVVTRPACVSSLYHTRLQALDAATQTRRSTKNPWARSAECPTAHMRTRSTTFFQRSTPTPFLIEPAAHSSHIPRHGYSAKPMPQRTRAKQLSPRHQPSRDTCDRPGAVHGSGKKNALFHLQPMGRFLAESPRRGTHTPTAGEYIALLAEDSAKLCVSVVKYVFDIVRHPGHGLFCSMASPPQCGDISKWTRHVATKR